MRLPFPAAPLKTILLFSIALFLTFSLHAEESEELFITLSTEKQLLPAYSAPWQTSRSSLPAPYLEQLRKVLLFDLNHNGSSIAVDGTSEMEQLAAEPFDAARWRELGIRHVVKVEVEDNQLTATLLSSANNTSTTLPAVRLSDNLREDRRKIHQIADAFHQTFFGLDGIASTRFLYTVRTGSSDEEQAISEVWVADYDGSNAEQVTHEGSYCVTPTFLPPNSGYTSGSFFYVSYRMGLPKIYVASLRDGAGRRFSYLRGNQLMPAITHQRDQVAFVSDAAGNPDIFLQRFNPEAGALGKPRQIFSAPRGAQASPTFSPDGRRIAFVSNKDGSPRIYVMEIPPVGSKLKDLTPTLVSKRNRGNTSPAWSPDGNKLAYSAMTRGTRQIWVYDFETHEELQLTQAHGHKENPTWAPDSLHLLYNTEDRSGAEIYLIDLNTRKPTRITSGRGEKRFPAWEPKG